MNLYLSSYGFGSQADKLRTFASNKRIGFIPNALDYVEAELEGTPPNGRLRAHAHQSFSSSLDSRKN